MIIAPNSVVTMHFSVFSEDKTQIDSSRNGAPMVYLQGSRHLIDGLEKAMLGKEAGDKFELSVEPSEAYGERQESLVQAVPKDMFEGMDVEPGMQFRATTDDGEQSVIIVDVTEEEVFVDGNHPLAGLTLLFEVEILEVREATEEEIAHGHAHGLDDTCDHKH
ncbi:peptidylprolyl isomerase [Alteromonadaceae bacterium M269]|nr:peptidylprolyl isomerase [Alteromonadaceae bacterium M269]